MMSDDEQTSNGGIVNVAVDNDEIGAKSDETPKSENLPRFRISIPTDHEIKNGVNPVLNNIEKGDEEKRDEADIGQVKETESEKQDVAPPKHVQIAIPADHNYNDTTHLRTHTHNTQTLGYMTHDAVPLSVFYRNQASIENVAGKDKRPTLELLHKGDGHENAKKRHWDASKEEKDLEESSEEKPAKPVTKLGWIKGVLFPTLLNIWGVILFLRMPWIVGQAGIGYSSVIVLLASCVTTVTALSMSAVCTNGEVKGGGAYYLISRSLGPEFGGSIGVIFSIANAVAVALYLVGFGETVQAVMERSGVEMVSKTDDVRIIGLIALVFIFIITLIGLDWVIHTQSVLLLLLIAAILAVSVGTIIPSPNESREKIESYGLPGYSMDNFKTNFVPDYRDGNGFFDVFAIFFPAATGIMAGANLSGDLKNPSKAVPLGTLLAIGMTSVSYVALAWLLGFSTDRDASGIIPFRNSTFVLNSTCQIGSCEYGSINDLQIMEKISLWGPLVLIGIFAATLSSALASLVSAPKVFQAVCKDKIFPHIDIFGKEYGRNGEPRNGYLLTLVIAAGFTAIGELNVIAPIISNFFLMAYALVNYSVFASSLSKSPGWRPSFKYYNMWISFIGFLLCIAIMFLINWWAALITIMCVAALYKYVDIRKPNINWGSSGQAHTYLKALRFTRRLEDIDDHVKNFRVQCLCLTGQPSLRPNLVHFASHITKHFGLLICGEVVVTDQLSPSNGHEGTWLKKHKIKAFHQIVQSESIRQGVNCMLQSSGLGKLKPNTLIIGYMSKWQKASLNKVDEYFHTIHDAFSLRYGVGILRLQDGFDITDEVVDDQIEDGVVDNHEPDWYTEDWDENQRDNHGSDGSDQAKDDHQPNLQPPDIVMEFHKKRKGYIDVWWLYDDGGLTILVPHILALSSHWRGCKLRIFTPASDKKIKANQIRMANLLKKFRIDFSSVVEFRGINKHPKEDSIKDFKKLRGGEHLPSDGALDKKTLRQIRLGELLHEHSSEAKLIVLTLPIPKQSFVTSLMYMSWLEVLSADLPPVLMLRGNQTSVLTFYS